ncbi:MAG: hypothetical protein WBQ78_15340 [Gammaproteobacteria bacterium]
MYLEELAHKKTVSRKDAKAQRMEKILATKRGNPGHCHTGKPVKIRCKPLLAKALYYRNDGMHKQAVNTA